MATILKVWCFQRFSFSRPEYRRRCFGKSRQFRIGTTRARPRRSELSRNPAKWSSGLLIRDSSSDSLARQPRRSTSTQMWVVMLTSCRLFLSFFPFFFLDCKRLEAFYMWQLHCIFKRKIGFNWKYVIAVSA